MKIGIDLRALQTGHKFRGIGEVTKQVTNKILQYSENQNDITFLFYEFDDDDPKELLTIPSNIRYAVIKQGYMPEFNKDRRMSDKVGDAYRALYGKPVIDSDKSDVFLQFDYAFGVPTDTKTLLVKHDLIPLIFWNQFFESPMVPFMNYAARTTLRTLFANYKYKRVLKRSLHNANMIATVSENTKKDILKYFRIDTNKIFVAHLGVSLEPAKTNSKNVSVKMPSKPYLLFVGAGDERRRVGDLVAAYNNLKASGHDIQLVLVGENFPDKHAIPNKITRDAVLDSSYGDDILTLGYVDDETKQVLYRDAIAFVYPTLYEGFGIPVLESMLMNCPVVTYKNSSIPEVAGEYALYADDWDGIQDRVKQLLSMNHTQKSQLTSHANTHAKKFTWDRTAKLIYRKLTNLQ